MEYQQMVEELGAPVRNQAALRRWMTAYASALSGTTSYEKIRDAATAGNDEKPAKTTVLRYLDTLERLWVIEPIPAWTPARNDLSRLALSPKHQLADPALAARLRGATIETLCSNLRLRSIFEPTRRQRRLGSRTSEPAMATTRWT